MKVTMLVSIDMAPPVATKTVELPAPGTDYAAEEWLFGLRGRELYRDVMASVGKWPPQGANAHTFRGGFWVEERNAPEDKA